MGLPSLFARPKPNRAPGRQRFFRKGMTGDSCRVGLAKFCHSPKAQPCKCANGEITQNKFRLALMVLQLKIAWRELRKCETNRKQCDKG